MWCSMAIKDAMAEHCSAIEEDDAWSLWSTVRDTTFEGRFFSLKVFSTIKRFIKNNKHVESGPPEFATAEECDG